MSSSIGKVLFLGLILTSMVKSRPVAAVDLIDTQSLLGAYSTPVVMNPTDQMAQSFTTTASGYVVSQVNLRLFRASGDSGTYSVDIYTANGSGASMVPGTLVNNVGSGSLIGGSYPVPVSSNSDGSDVADVSFTGLNINLSSTPTDYFILVSYTGGYSLNWSTVSATAPVFNGAGTYMAQVSSGTGSNWGADDPALLKVVAGTSVPEPSTWAMGALAVAGLAASARRRRAQD